MGLARAASSAGVRRFVFVSSAGVGGFRSYSQPLRETDVPCPQTLYARSKAIAEEHLASWSARSLMECVIVRPPLVYGPEAPGNLRRLNALIMRGVPLPFGAVRNERTVIGVDNLADLLLRCAFHPGANGEIFYAGDGVISTPELVRTIAEGMRRTVSMPRVSPFLLKWGALASGSRIAFDQLCGSLVLDCSKAKTRLDWQPVRSMRDGLLEMGSSFKRGNSL